MKKITLYVLMLILIVVSSFCVGAEKETINDEEYYFEQLEQIIEPEVAKVLSDIGIENLTVDEIYSVSLSGIGEYFSDCFKDKISGFTADMFSVTVTLILIITVRAFFVEERNADTLNLISVPALVLCCTGAVNTSLNGALAALKMNSAFTSAFVPILTLLISLSGNISFAITYNSLVLLAGQGITVFINNFFVEAVGIFMSVSVAFGLNKSFNLNRFTSAANKAIAFFVGFAASLFSALLSVRGVLSAAVDTAGAKSIRFLISSLIPIVGSSISDAYSSLIGSINLIKGSVAVVGIIVILIISIPSLIECLMYGLGFSFFAFISDIAGCSAQASMLRALQSCIRAVIMLCVLQIFVLIVSTGIALSFKGAM